MAPLKRAFPPQLVFRRIMNENTAMLDLDDAGSFLSALYALIDSPSIWSCLKSDLTTERRLFLEIADKTEFVTSPLIHDLRNEAECIIRAEYMSVAVYHACCPITRETYTQFGLLRTNRQLLHQLTREAFGSTPEIEIAFEPRKSSQTGWTG